MGGRCVINPGGLGFSMQASPPAGDLFYITPVLSYFSQLNPIVSSEAGGGWTHTFKRQVQLSGSTATVITGSGQSYNYTVVKGSGFAAPTNGAVNSLQATAGGASFTETQPDGTLYQYGSAVSGGTPAPLLYIQNPAGARWTVSYDLASRVSSVTDPILRLTTLAYDGAGKLSSILDPFGRRTTITVNGGDLVQFLSPELCLTSMVYNTNHLMLAWINPLGDRTTFAGGEGNQLVVTSPLGAATTLTGHSQMGGAFRPRVPGNVISVITNPLGHVTSLGFDITMSMLQGASDALGNITTYNWDSHQRLAGIFDGLGNATSFSYVLFNNKVESLTSVQQSLGGIFTYSYDSNNRVNSLTDQLGNVSTLVWNSSGLRTAAVDCAGKPNVVFL